MTHPTDEELNAMVKRAMVIDPLLEVDFDTQRGVEQDPYGAREAIETALYLIRDQTAAITALRAQLAEADAMIESQAKDHAENNIRLAEMSHRVSQLEGMVVSGQGEQIRLAADLLQAKIECNKANARADLAEAALAAQIEYGPVRTGLVDKDGREICVGDRLRHLNSSPSTKKEYWFPEYEVIWDAPAFRLKPTGGGKPSDTRFYFKYYSREFETIRNQPHDRSALDRLLADAEALKVQEVQALVEVLAWYGEQARLCRLIHREGDAGRLALQSDGGGRAIAALRAIEEGKA